METTSLGRAILRTADGDPIRLAELWGDRPAVIAWLRHYGCLFCKEQARELRDQETAIEERGGRLAFVGSGAPHFARGFRDEYCRDCLILNDPSRHTYELIGAHRGVMSTLGPRAWGPAVRAFTRGNRQRNVQGDPFQQGGILVIAPGGKVLYRHLSAAAGDHPPVAEILAALETFEHQVRGERYHTADLTV